jgi:hypothetical protein
MLMMMTAWLHLHGAKKPSYCDVGVEERNPERNKSNQEQAGEQEHKNKRSYLVYHKG